MIPATLTSGDTVTWTDAPILLQGETYTAAGYTLTYALRGADGPVDVVGVVEGIGWRFTLSAVQASALGAGTWYWTKKLTATNFQITAGRGELTVLADLSANAAGGYDGRSQARQDLDAVEAVIRARTSGGAVIEYTIGNRSLKKESLAALLALRTQLHIRCRNESVNASLANGLGDPRTLYARFN